MVCVGFGGTVRVLVPCFARSVPNGRGHLPGLLDVASPFAVQKVLAFSGALATIARVLGVGLL
jgi:hypothetical protein